MGCYTRTDVDGAQPREGHNPVSGKIFMIPQRSRSAPIKKPPCEGRPCVSLLLGKGTLFREDEQLGL